MAFSLDNWDKLSTAGIEGVRKIWAYTDTDVALLTLAASAYFNDVDHYLTIGDSIMMRGSDGVGQYEITAVSPNVTMEAATDPGALSETLTSAYIFVGNVSNVATGVAMTGDISITNAGVTAIVADTIINADVKTDAAIAFSKLEVMTSGNILVGSAGNVATEVTMSGDATIIASGALTIANNAVTSSKVATSLLQYAVVSISAAEFNGMYAAPHLLVAAAGANTLITLHRAEVLMTYVAAQYTAGGVVAIQYDSTANGAGIIASSTQAAADFADAASTANAFNGGEVKNPFATCVNKGLYLSNVTQAFTTGDSTFEMHLWYSVVATV